MCATQATRKTRFTAYEPTIFRALRLAWGAPRNADDTVAGEIPPFFKQFKDIFDSTTLVVGMVV